VDEPCPKCGNPQCTIIEIYQEYVPKVDFPKIVEKLDRTGKFEE
jgi:transposase